MSAAAADVLTVVAASTAATVVLMHPRRQRPIARHVTPAASSEGGQIEAGLAVCLLGPVLVTRAGGPVALTARQRELVAFLASHPGGVSEDRLRAALWGDRPATRGSFNNLVSATRHRLGSIDGQPALPAVGEDRLYRLHPDVDCDLRLLDTADSPSGATGLLRAVRGRPFDAPRGYGWVDRDGLAAWAATRIASVAHDLADAHLAEGDAAAALVVAQQGLLGACDERLYADRMRAHAAMGDRAAAERVMDELLAVFDAEDPIEVLHPDTLEVYARCGGRRPVSAQDRW